MEENSVLVFGSVAYDCIETPFDKADYILGGSASYAALASSFFAPTKMVGVVGGDFKQDDIRRLSARGIDIRGLEIKSEGQTFFWRGKYCNNFNERDTLEVRVNVYENYDPKIPEALRNCPFVLLGNIDPSVQTKVLDKMESPRFVILDTMNLWIEIANKPLRELIKRADILILNDSEARQLANENNLILCGDLLREMGAKSVIIKKGEHGAMLFHADGFFTLPAYPVRALHDPTGAGDSFAGALAGYMAGAGSTDFETIKRAMLAGTAAASITVESFSCYKLEESGLAEVEAREEHIRKITAV